MSAVFNIASAQYLEDADGNNVSVLANMDSVEVIVPIDTDNRHYQAILDWVADGNTIQDAN